MDFQQSECGKLKITVLYSLNSYIFSVFTSLGLAQQSRDTGLWEIMSAGNSRAHTGQQQSDRSTKITKAIYHANKPFCTSTYDYTLSYQIHIIYSLIILLLAYFDKM